MQLEQPKIMRGLTEAKDSREHAPRGRGEKFNSEEDSLLHLDDHQDDHQRVLRKRIGGEE